MKVIRGYFWEFIDDCDGIVCTTNGIVKKDGSLVMGKGIALAFAERWPELPKLWGKKTKQFGSNVFVDVVDGKALVAFPTKFHFLQDSSIELIKHGLPRLVKAADKFNLTKILVPPLGCGNGNLTWHYVKPVMEKALDDRFTVCL